MTRTNTQQLRTTLARSHLYSDRPPNNSLRLAAAFLCLGPSNSRIHNPKASRVVPGSLETNRPLDRRIPLRQGSHNRVVVCYFSKIYCLNITNPNISIWQHSGPATNYRAVWQYRRKWPIWEHPAARYSAASWPTVHLRPVRKQDSHTDSWGRRNFWQHFCWPNKHDLCPCTI
jgi:hypothetical protein